MTEQEIEVLARAVAEKLARRGGLGGRSVIEARLVERSPAVPPSRRPAERLATTTIRVADFIDHTLLKAEARRSEIETLCAEAKQYRFAAVCVNGCWVARCAELLRGTGVKVAAVAGFPLGAMTSGAKAAEVRQLVGDGADEIDMVAAIGHIIDQDWDYVEDDIRAVIQAARDRTVKVILETAALDSTLIVKAAAIAKEAGARFVKTSTGFHPAGGATVDAVTLMRAAVGPDFGVKAAGGIRDCATALTMIAAGATRLGTSSGVKLVDCLGSGDMKLDELLAGAHQHGATCKTGSCKTEAY
jgi:deoxyribose-phosphate aldolase